MKQLTAVVLAGGIGKRFTPFIHDKTLFPFMEQSLLERTLRMIERSGISKVIVATNPFNDPWLKEHRSSFSFELTTHMQSNPKGMADALLSLEPLLPERDIIVMNAGDMVEEHLLSGLLQSLAGYDAVLTGREMPIYQPVGYFILEGETIKGIIEKPGADKMPSTLGSLVFHYFGEPQLFTQYLKSSAAQADDGADDIYEQALNTLIETKKVGCYRYNGTWQKLKFGYHVLDMSEFFLKTLQSSIDPSAKIAPSAVIKGSVVIQEGAQVLEGAVIQGPCFIGKNVIIGNGALVRQSIVEANSVIGYGSEVVRSYIGANCDLHHAYVGDSALEESVHFGYGAHTANFRLDHQPITLKQLTGDLPTDKVKLGALIAKKVEIGVNTSILPGVSIGTNVSIYPGAIVRSAIADSHILKHEQAQKIVPKNPRT